jgi:hypothetical protein
LVKQTFKRRGKIAEFQASVRQIFQTASCQFFRAVLIEAFLHGQGHDDLVAALEERFSQPPRYEDTKF